MTFCIIQTQGAFLNGRKSYEVMLSSTCLFNMSCACARGISAGTWAPPRPLAERFPNIQSSFRPLRTGHPMRPTQPGGQLWKDLSYEKEKLARRRSCQNGIFSPQWLRLCDPCLPPDLPHGMRLFHSISDGRLAETSTFFTRACSLSLLLKRKERI